MSSYVGKDGKTYSPTGLGYSLAFLPAVASTDILYKIYDVTPAVYFPLESDWLILLLASFTNAFFGAGLAIVLFLYFLEIKLSKNQAILMTFISIFATNLLVYAKHSFAQMMFTFFMFLAFFLVKKFFSTKNIRYLFFSGLSFGALSITYNLTWVLAVPGLILYYFLLQRKNTKKINLKNLVQSGAVFFLGLFPFLLIGALFESLRALGGGTNGTSSSFYYSEYIYKILGGFKPTVLYEGIYGQLLSPGRSVFLYSPVLILIILFWNKIKRTISPEAWLLLCLSLTFVLFYAIQFSIGTAQQGIAALWHGESSWGPRYLIPVIPFALLIVGSIVNNLSKLQKLLILVPLIIFGIYIQLLGLLIPYQDKFHNMEKNFFVNQTEYTSYGYINLLPRFSPLLTMPKELFKVVRNLPKTVDHGKYNVHFYDGIDFPFNVGPERWRTIKNVGTIYFDNSPENTVKKISLGLINHPITQSTNSATIKFKLNNNTLGNDLVIKTSERKTIDLEIKPEYLKPEKNKFEISVNYANPKVIYDNIQLLAIISASINDTPVNLETLEFPFISPLGPKMTGVAYNTFGNNYKDPWMAWEIHTQIYERIPDFWWLKNMYFWDVPKKTIIMFLILNIFLIVYFGIKVNSSYKKLNKSLHRKD